MTDTPQIRKTISSVDRWKDCKSSYPKSRRTWGYVSQVMIGPKERMREKMAACFAGVKAKLEQDVPGIIFNAPEVFPVNHNACVVLITGWKLETLVLNS